MGTEIVCLIMMDMFMDTWIFGFSNNTQKYLPLFNKFFTGILNLWIALPTKLNVQQKNDFTVLSTMFLQTKGLYKLHIHVFNKIVVLEWKFKPTC